MVQPREQLPLPRNKWLQNPLHASEVKQYPNQVEFSRFAPAVRRINGVAQDRARAELTLSQKPDVEKVEITHETRKLLAGALEHKMVRVDQNPDGTVGFSFGTGFDVDRYTKEVRHSYGQINLDTGIVSSPGNGFNSGEHNPGIPKDVLALMREEKSRMEAEKKI